jgi:hypothetical protein
VAFLVAAGTLLITVSIVTLVLRLTATPSTRDYLVFCGSILGLLLGCIALAYALPKL